MNTIKLNIEGMKCEGCENRIKNSLKLLDNIEEVNCSYAQKEVMIYATKEIDVNEVKKTIEDLGFEVKED